MKITVAGAPPDNIVESAQVAVGIYLTTLLDVTLVAPDGIEILVFEGVTAPQVVEMYYQELLARRDDQDQDEEERESIRCGRCLCWATVPSARVAGWFTERFADTYINPICPSCAQELTKGVSNQALAGW